jgi:carboxymethylenebutenolidase
MSLTAELRRWGMLLLVALLAQGVKLEVAAGQEWAVKQLEESPRHGEWVVIEYGGRKVDAFVVFPEVKEKAMAVVVIHEIFGLTDWVRTVADELAANGYIAIAPDLLSGSGPEGGNTSSFKGGDGARQAIAKLAPDQITADLNASADYVAKLPACNGKVAVAGFCWGGGQAFRYATNNPKLVAAFPFYGSGPTVAAELDRVACPVYGFYARNDARINTTVEQSEKLMQAAGKTFEPVYYDDAGHGFMRAGQAPDASEGNRAGRAEAWKRLLALLKKTAG